MIICPTDSQQKRNSIISLFFLHSSHITTRFYSKTSPTPTIDHSTSPGNSPSHNNHQNNNNIENNTNFEIITVKGKGKGRS